jgi:luciferase-type oxidoreductase
MEKQVELAQLSEKLGFIGLWFRGVLLEDPNFGDTAVGQIYDMMIYLTYLTGKTEDIALGTAAAVLPLRHPLRVAKEIATIDQLFPGRILLGVSSGVRRADFAALGASHPDRGHTFVEAYHYLQEVLYREFPHIESTRRASGGEPDSKTDNRHPDLHYRICPAGHELVRRTWRWLDVLSSQSS